MDEALRRAGWIVIVVVILAYGTYLLAGSTFNPSPEVTIPIVVRDSVRAGEHHLSGMLIVASTCDQLRVTSQQIDEDEFRLVFESWPEPSVDCVDRPSPRVFDTVVFAPSLGVRFSAVLDKKPLEIAVYPTINNQ